MKERNNCLDFFKGLSALGVIYVHIMFPGIFGKLMCAVGSCGVLYFFLISGYAANGPKEHICPKLMKRFRRNLLLLLAVIPAYIAASLYELHMDGQSPVYWRVILKRPEFYVRLFLLGDLDLIHGDPLWFMFALLYAYLIFWLINRFGLQKAARIAMPFFLIMRIIMVIYKNTYDKDWHLCSNVLVSALPMMLLGYWIAEKKEKVQALSDKAVILNCILSAVCVGITVCVKPAGFDLSPPFKIWAAACWFVLACKKPQLTIFRPLAKLGRDYSLYIYLLHMPLLVVLYVFFDSRRMPDAFFSWALPVIVTAAAILLAMLLTGSGKLFRRFRAASSAVPPSPQ